MPYIEDMQSFKSRNEFSPEEELVYCKAKLEVARQCSGHIAYWEARVKELEQKLLP
jgi:hypothetical protein